MVRLEPGLAGQAPHGSLWQVQTGGSRTKAKYKDKVLKIQCQGAWDHPDFAARHLSDGDERIGTSVSPWTGDICYKSLAVLEA